MSLLFRASPLRFSSVKKRITALLMGLSILINSLVPHSRALVYSLIVFCALSLFSLALMRLEG